MRSKINRLNTSIFHYDPIGNLVQDVNEGIDQILWTVTGKVSDVIFSSSKDDLTFRYDPMGNRIAKIQKPKNWTDEEEWTITWYARDAQGNGLAVYNKAKDSVTFRATEFNIYGSSRIGMVTQPEELTENSPDPVAFSQTLGNKVYEFSNHLGNVLTTFSDRKIATEGVPGFVAYYTSEILSSTDYYPFGFQMPGRVYEADGYRYGFNSMEKDDELKGSGNSYDFGARICDPRVGRWLAVDPLAQVYASFSPFCFSMLSPIFYKDIAGQFVVITIDDENQKKALETLISTVFDGKVKAQVNESKVHGYILQMNIADNFSTADLTKEQQEAYEYFKTLINDPKVLNCTLATSTGGDFFDNWFDSKLFPDDINKIPESEDTKKVKLAILFHFFSEQASKQWTFKEAIDYDSDHAPALKAGFEKLKIKWDKALSTVKEVADLDFIDGNKNYLSTLRVARLKDGNLRMNFFNVEKKGTKYSTMRHEKGPYVRDLEWQAERFKKYPIAEPDSVEDKSNDNSDETK